MIAVALGLISIVVMVATGVVVSSSGADRLTFLGVAVETTTAQVFLTGAIFAWLFIVALWLLRVGMQRSGARCEDLAGRWAGLGARFGLRSHEGLEVGLPAGLAEASVLMGPMPGTAAGPASPSAGAPDVLGLPRWSGVFGSSGASGIATAPGASGDGGGAPRRVDRGPNLADGAVAAALDQPGPLAAGGGVGPGAGNAVVGINVDRCGQGGEVGGGARLVAGEHRRAEDERRDGAGGQ